MTQAQNWQTDWYVAQAALAWQHDLGADEAICDSPVNRFDLPTKPAATPKPLATNAAAQASAPAVPKADPVAEAAALAQAAQSLNDLRAALENFGHCDLKLGARNLVFADGTPDADVMIIGEAPGREEDLRGVPFVGDAGQMLDRMFAAIDMRRTHPDHARALYITNILPWRPPQNRDPSAEERAMMRPFVQRHIELIDPQYLILMGRISAGTLLNTTEGITRLRGQWQTCLGRPALPMLHPAYLLRNPSAKREAWADLLALQAKLREPS